MMSDDKSLTGEKSNKRSFSKTSIVSLTFCVVTILSLAILDLVQFYIHPIDVKIDHAEVFLTSPTTSTVVAPNDFSVSLFLDFKSGSSFFTTGLTSTTCDVDYLFMKEDEESSREFLTNVKVSDVTLRPTFKLFSTVTTTHQIDFVVSNIHYESLFTALKTEGTSLTSESGDKSYIATNCKTVLRFGSLSMPFELNQLLSLDEYKHGFQSQLSVLRSHLSSPEATLKSMCSELMAFLLKDKSAVNRKLSSSSFTSDFLDETTVDVEHAKDELENNLNDLLRSQYDAFSEMFKQIGYIIVRTPEIVLSVGTSVVRDTVDGVKNKDRKLITSKAAVKAAVQGHRNLSNKQRSQRQLSTVESQEHDNYEQAMENTVIQGNELSAQSQSKQAMSNGEKVLRLEQWFPYNTQCQGTPAYTNYGQNSFNNCLYYGYDYHYSINLYYKSTCDSYEYKTATYSDSNCTNIFSAPNIYLSNVCYSSDSYYSSYRYSCVDWNDVPESWGGPGEPEESTPIEMVEKAINDDWLPSAGQKLSDLLSQITLKIPAEVFDSRHLSFNGLNELVCDIAGEEGGLWKSFGDVIAEKNDIDIDVSLASVSPLAHGLFRNAVSSSSVKRRETVSSTNMKVKFVSGGQIQAALQNGQTLSRRLEDATEVPSAAPVATTAPSTAPVATTAPSAAPVATTEAPSAAAPIATTAPSAAPVATAAPSAAPVATTEAPSAAPVATTEAPSAAPIAATAPSAAPVPTTEAPSAAPVATTAPSAAPIATTEAPSASPVATTAPSAAPIATTEAPSAAPIATTEAPSAAPVVTVTPSVSPTAAFVPTAIQTFVPTAIQTFVPSPASFVTIAPSTTPSAVPVATNAVPTLSHAPNSGSPYAYYSTSGVPTSFNSMEYAYGPPSRYPNHQYYGGNNGNNGGNGESPFVKAIIELSPSILKFLEKVTGISEDDFIVESDVMCVTIEGMNLDGAFCSYAEKNIGEKNSTSTILSANILSSTTNTSFNFYQEVKEYTVLKSGWVNVYGYVPYTYCTYYSYTFTTYCYSYYYGYYGYFCGQTYYCAYYATSYYYTLVDGYGTLEPVQTGQIDIKQTIDLTYDDVYAYNSFELSTSTESAVITQGILLKPNYEYYSGSANIEWNSKKVNEVWQTTIDCQSSFDTNNKANHYTSAFDLDYQTSTASVTYSYPYWVDKTVTTKLTLDVDFKQTLPKPITYFAGTYDQKEKTYESWDVYTHTEPTFDFAHSISLQFPDDSVAYITSVSTHSQNASHTHSYTHKNNEIYEIGFDTKWIQSEKGVTHYEANVALDLDDKSEKYGTSFLVKGETTQAGQIGSSVVSLNVKRFAPDAYTYFEIAESTMMRLYFDANNYIANETLSLKDAHITVNNKKLYGTSGLIRIMAPELTFNTDQQPALFQFRLDSSADSESQFAMNELVQMSFDSENESGAVQILSSMSVDHVELYDWMNTASVSKAENVLNIIGASTLTSDSIAVLDATADGVVNLDDKTYIVNLEESVSLKTGYIKGNLNNVHGLKSLINSVEESKFRSVSAKPSLRPTRMPSFVPSRQPSVPGASKPSRMPTQTPTRSPAATLAPTKAPTATRTAVSFGVQYGMTGVTATQLIGNAAKAARDVLCDTVKACLTNDVEARKNINVTIASVSDKARRLSAQLPSLKTVHVEAAGGVDVQFRVQFVLQDVVDTTSSGGGGGTTATTVIAHNMFTTMTVAFAFAATSGNFTAILHATAASYDDDTLLSATGSTTAPVFEEPVIVVETTNAVESEDDDEALLAPGEIAAIAICGAFFLIVMISTAVYFSGMCTKSSTSTTAKELVDANYQKIIVGERGHLDEELGVSHTANNEAQVMQSVELMEKEQHI